MKHYDFKKAIYLINESKDCLESASLGMHEDWFWTANTVFENNEFIIDLNKVKEIAGIDGSPWATPTLNLLFSDGEDKMIPCYTSDGEEMPLGEKVAEMILWTSGCLSSVVQENITELTTIKP